MILSENIVNGLYSHFYDIGLRNSILKKDNFFSIYNFEFIFKMNNRNLEVLILLPKKIDPASFQQHFQSIQTPSFWEKFPLVRKKREDYEAYLARKQLIYENGNYSFQAEVRTEDNEKAIDGILNYVIKPVILFKVIGK